MEKIDLSKITFEEINEQGNATELFFTAPKEMLPKPAKADLMTICISIDADGEKTAFYSPTIFVKEENAYVDVDTFDYDISEEDIQALIDKAMRSEISKTWYTQPKNRYEEGLKDQALKDMKIIDKYRAESDIEKRKPCINYEDGCEEWAGCPCVYYKSESEVQRYDETRI